ncbi:MAG: hypothetical protein KC609_23355 [Myxococcales bacterium]|nr:hypothetical protein [Myxococcales bacterium]
MSKKWIVLAFSALLYLGCGGNGANGNLSTADQTQGDGSVASPDAKVTADIVVPTFDVQTTFDSVFNSPDTSLQADLNVAPDLGVELDLSGAIDAKLGPDGFSDPDLTLADDLGPAEDSTDLPDVAVVPDLSAVPDVVDHPDAAVVPDTKVEPDVTPDTQQPTGIPSLGGGTHLPSNVTIEILADTSNTTLSTPRDLAFNPMYANELWIVNYETESMTILLNVDNPDAPRVHRQTATGHHFLARPSSLAFGKLGFLATCHETAIKTQDTTPADFMGPTLFTSNLAEFDGGHGGHYDMLHNTPNGMGIAWEKDNVYWVFDGYHSSLTRYDFQEDHGAGGSDHTDGIVWRFVEGQVKRVAGVPSHLYYVPSSALLYVADTGNNRIAILDTTTGTFGATITPNYDGSTQLKVDNATLTTLIEGSTMKMERPSGLEIHDDVLYVTDNKTSVIYAFTLQGKLIDYLQIHETIPSGSMMGIALDKSNRIYLVDSTGNRIIRLSPK